MEEDMERESVFFLVKNENEVNADMSYAQLPLHHHQIPASRMVLGCMRFGGEWDGLPITSDLVVEGHRAVEAARNRD